MEAQLKTEQAGGSGGEGGDLTLYDVGRIAKQRGRSSSIISDGTKDDILQLDLGDEDEEPHRDHDSVPDRPPAVVRQDR